MTLFGCDAKNEKPHCGKGFSHTRPKLTAGLYSAKKWLGNRVSDGDGGKG